MKGPLRVLHVGAGFHPIVEQDVSVICLCGDGSGNDKRYGDGRRHDQANEDVCGSMGHFVTILIMSYLIVPGVTRYALRE